MGVVFTGTIDSQYFCGESLVDFLLPYGSPRTCSRQKEKAEFLRISNGSVFSIAIKMFHRNSLYQTEVFCVLIVGVTNIRGLLNQGTEMGDLF